MRQIQIYTMENYKLDKDKIINLNGEAITIEEAFKIILNKLEAIKSNLD